MRPGMTYLTLTAAVAFAAPLAGQQADSTPAQRREAAIVLDHTFTSTIGEPIHVFLTKGVVYRAEIEGGGIQIQLKPLMASTQGPLIQPLLSGMGAAGSSTYVVTPRADAEYIFTTLGGDASRPVKVRVYAMPMKEKKPAKP